MNAWLPFTDDFAYKKMYYDVKLHNGTILYNCWPNAGKMNETGNHRSERGYTPEDQILVREARKCLQCDGTGYDPQSHPQGPEACSDCRGFGGRSCTWCHGSGKKVSGDGRRMITCNMCGGDCADHNEDSEKP